MWRVDKDGPAYATLYDGDRYVGCVMAADAARIVAAMNAAETNSAEIAALTYERDVFHSIITENDGPMTKTEELLDAAPETYQRELVRELCLSMASFIAEIDANSIDVASYIEQRLSPILMKPAVRALLDVVGKDARQLIGWKRPAEPARKAVCNGKCVHGLPGPMPFAVCNGRCVHAIPGPMTVDPECPLHARKAVCGTCGGRGRIHCGDVACPDCAPR